MDRFLTIHSAKLAAIQDLGRFGYEHIGVGVNGALDTYAYVIGNKLVGNTSLQPSIEITAFDFSMSSSVDVMICITGAVADIAIDSVPVPMWETVVLPAGRRLTVSKIRKGLRVYIAVAGGIKATQILGSCTPDPQAGLGDYIKPGQIIPLETDVTDVQYVHRSLPRKSIPFYGSPWPIRICEGPDTAIFTEEWERFLNAAYVVSPDSNHIGIRLNGPALTNYSPKHVLSRGIGIGAIEIIPSGQPIVLHRGRGVTAGYPIIGVVTTVDLSMLGQVRPGDTVKFIYITIEEAIQLHREQQRRIEMISSSC